MVSTEGQIKVKEKYHFSPSYSRYLDDRAGKKDFY